MSWFRAHRQESAAGLAAGLVALAVYVWTAAPNVTLLDSGEFLVAAQHFGVPHPTGYPLWTLLAWIFQLLPLGNAAWETNIFSGVCGALAVGLAAGTLTNLLRWFLEGRLEGRLRVLPGVTGAAFGLMFAFSQSMWSQAVIAEVYTLHALLIGLYLCLLYGWVRHPGRDRLMLWAFFVLALSFSNHHLTLALSPLPFLLILLLRRRALPDWIFAGALAVLPVYLGFAILSEDLAVLRTALRLFYCVVLGGGVFVWIRRGRVRWRLVAFLPIAVAGGLLPYAYMPLASSTNPPMNWAYAREQKGFFYSINRSQYSGSLADQTLRALGPFMGTGRPTGPATVEADGRPSRLETAQAWVGFFWVQLSRAFTPFALIGYFASIFFILRHPLPQRTWIYLLHFAFVLAAFAQPVLDGAGIDVAGWWLQMPYHTYTNFIFALLAGLGTGLLLERLCRRRALYFWLVPGLLVLPVYTFVGSEPSASQRGRWFGWMFGYDMLKDLPKGSVVIGGTDPGRFVPTYMILGESPQDPRHKRDPEFDRRDLYIITQNALGEEFYMKYLGDHYGKDRPAAKNAFERWLGRDSIYPSEPLDMPTAEEIAEAVKKATGDEPAGADISMAVFSEALRVLWEKNKDRHEFFVEESFPIKWTYDYAVPHGLVYRINKEKLDAIPPEAVARDFAFWDGYKKRLLADKNFRNDLDARRSFSKLRNSIANLYAHRKMRKEAELAYREALELYPSSMETLIALCEMLWEDNRYDEAAGLLETAFAGDPNNLEIVRLAVISNERKKYAAQTVELTGKLEANPKDRKAFEELLAIHAMTGNTNGAAGLIDRSLTNFQNEPDVLRLAANYSDSAGMSARAVAALELLAGSRPDEEASFYFLARARLRGGQTNKAAEAAKKAVELGGQRTRERFLADPDFKAVTNSPDFREIFRTNLLPGEPAK